MMAAQRHICATVRLFHGVAGRRALAKQKLWPLFLACWENPAVGASMTSKACGKRNCRRYTVTLMLGTVHTHVWPVSVTTQQ